LDFFGEVLRWDAGVGLLGAVGGGLLMTSDRADIAVLVSVASGFVGVVIGAAIAGAAVLAAFMDQPFLRKLGALGYTAGFFLAPLVFTAILGVVAALCLLLVLGLGNAPHTVRLVPGILAGFFTVYSITSLLPAIANFTQFAETKSEAAKIPDDRIPPAKNA
jgi:hypothetical protein